MSYVETLLNLLVLLGVVFGIPCLIYVSIPPNAGRKRVLLKAPRGKSHVEIPSVCVVTGQPATERHALRRFFCFFNFFWYGEITLPFSVEGYQSYRRQYPVSMWIYKGVFFICSQMNVGLPFGLPLAFLWSIWGTPLCGLIAIVDVARGKRQLIQVQSGAVAGVSDQFSEAFTRANISQ